LLKYPHLNAGLSQWSDDPNENWDKLEMEVEKSNQMEAQIASYVAKITMLDVSVTNAASAKLRLHS